MIELEISISQHMGILRKMYGNKETETNRRLEESS
jgi:hypothetical protein